MEILNRARFVSACAGLAVFASSAAADTAARTAAAADPFLAAIGLADSAATAAPPPAQPMLGLLLAGFVLLVIGLAALTVRRQPRPEINTSAAGRRALMYAIVYGLCTACFLRVIGPALIGQSRSPWLFALGDVIFVTLGLFVWVMVLAEGHDLKVYGFHGGRTARLPLALIMGLGAVVVTAFDSYYALFTGKVIVTADSLVFSLLFALVASALPEEVLFRGYLQSSLDRRTQRWARVVAPALAFTAIRAMRSFPGISLGSPEWMVYIFGVVLPLGLWWGLMRDLAGGSLWPSLVSHFFVAFGTTLASTSSNPS